MGPFPNLELMTNLSGKMGRMPRYTVHPYSDEHCNRTLIENNINSCIVQCLKYYANSRIELSTKETTPSTMKASTIELSRNDPVATDAKLPKMP